MLLVLSACGRIGFDASSDATPSPADGAGDASPPDAAACTRRFCDGFEGGLAGWDGEQTENGSTVSHLPAGGFRGDAMRAQGPTGAAIAAVFKDVFSPLPADLHVRAYVHAPGGQLLDLEPVELTTRARDHQIVFAIYDADIEIHAHSIAGDFQTSAATPMPRDRWVCFELHVAIGATGTVELFMDGALIVAQPGLDTRPGNGDLSHVFAGIASKPGTIASDVSIDEVVADTAPIGCD